MHIHIYSYTFFFISFFLEPFFEIIILSSVEKRLWYRRVALHRASGGSDVPLGLAALGRPGMTLEGRQGRPRRIPGLD